MFRGLQNRWVGQSVVGIALVVVLNFAFGAATASTAQSQTTGISASGGCEPGFSGSPATGCKDVDECAVSNGGCHRLTACDNTAGSRTCGGCPKDYVGNGYIGCFDVNECSTPDCSDRLPSRADAENAPAPSVTTSGDVTVAASSSSGAVATFTAAAKDSVEGTRPVNCTPASGSTFAVGKTTVTCWAFNKRGKIGRSTLTVSVTQ
jgi:hypothetical protein